MALVRSVLRNIVLLFLHRCYCQTKLTRFDFSSRTHMSQTVLDSTTTRTQKTRKFIFFRILNLSSVIGSSLASTSLVLELLWSYKCSPHPLIGKSLLTVRKLSSLCPSNKAKVYLRRLDLLICTVNTPSTTNCGFGTLLSVPRLAPTFTTCVLETTPWSLIRGMTRWLQCVSLSERARVLL